MRIRRRREISVETHQVVTISKPGREVVTRCAECGEQVRMLTIEEAMAMTSASSRQIHRRIEAGEVHFTETTEGFLLMCMNSLLESN